MHRPILLAASSLLALAAPAGAQQVPATQPAAEAHPDPDQAIVVTGVRRSNADVLGSVTVVNKDELVRELSTSIGDTLASLPGVTSSSFGPSASRPILRGLSGERIRVLVDGIGSLDLSSSDPDHAVAVNPLTAEKIEVLRGPASLIYGSSAIGGVVNVIDSRIPRRVPADGLGGEILLNGATAANERSANGSVDVALGEHLVAHADASASEYDDLKVGGFVLSRPLRQQAEASDDPAIRALADLKGKLPNSGGNTAGAAAGLAYIDGGLNLGVSIARSDNYYGVPVRYSLDPAIEAEAPSIDARQDRADARAEIPLSGAFRAFHFRGGIARYHHDEVEENGEIGSSFYSNGGEARAELLQQERGGWGGTSGVQFLDQDVRIRGEEKYLPDADNRQVGLFTLQTLISGPWRAEAGARIEFDRVRAEADGDLGTPAARRTFTPVSAAVGGSYDLGGDWRLGLSLSHSERAPSIDELYSNGPHGGTQSFLIGDPDLAKEKSNGVELSLRRNVGQVHVQASAYASNFSNFITQVPTGEIVEDLPLYRYISAKARLRGFEVEADTKLGKALGIDWGAEITADAVRATLKGLGPAPQIPPFRVLGALTGARGAFDGRIEVERVAAQNRTAAFETRTPGYTMVNAGIDWHLDIGSNALTLSLQADNIFDVEARRASSLLKDYAPLAGRDFRLSARFSF